MNQYDDDEDEIALVESFEDLWQSSINANVFPSTYRREQRCIYEASKAGDLEMVQDCLASDPLLLDTPDAFNATVLYYASLCGHVRIVSYLLYLGATCDSTLYEGERALYGALNNKIRGLLEEAQAVERHTGGPLTLFLARVFNDPTERGLCDVTFFCGGISIHCHRVILAARSSYFRDKFSGPWKGKKEVFLNNPSLSGPALFNIFKYLYLDKFISPLSLVPISLTIARNLRLTTLADALGKISQVGEKVITINLTPSQRWSSDTLSPLDSGEGGVREALWHNIVNSSECPFHDLLLVSSVEEEGEEKIVCATPLPTFTFLLCGRAPFFSSLLRFHTNGEALAPPLPSQPPRHLSIADIPRDALRLILGWVHSDYLPPNAYPLQTLLHALHSAHMCLIKDGIVPALVSEIIRAHSQLPKEEGVLSVAVIWGVGETLGLQRLQEQCCAYTCEFLPQILATEDFTELLVESSKQVDKRQEWDSVPVLDTLKSKLRERGDEVGIGLLEEKANTLGFKLRR